MENSNYNGGFAYRFEINSAVSVDTGRICGTIFVYSAVVMSVSWQLFPNILYTNRFHCRLISLGKLDHTNTTRNLYLVIATAQTVQCVLIGHFLRKILFTRNNIYICYGSGNFIQSVCGGFISIGHSSKPDLSPVLIIKRWFYTTLFLGSTISIKASFVFG